MKFKNKSTGKIIEPHEKWLEEKFKKDNRYVEVVSDKKDTTDSKNK